MVSRWLRRAVVTAAVASLWIFAATPASADVTPNVPLRSGHIGELAGQFEFVCDANQGGGEVIPGKDIWVFNARSGEFVEVRVTFDGGAGDNVDVVIEGPQDPYPNGIASAGSDKAWVVVPAGWTIVSAVADIDWGDKPAKNDFVVTHTCAGTPDDDEECELTPEECNPEPPCEEAGAELRIAAAVAEDECDEEETTTPSPGGNNLPTTGASLGGLIALAVALVGGGVALLLFRRRRDAIDTAS